MSKRSMSLLVLVILVGVFASAPLALANESNNGNADGSHGTRLKKFEPRVETPQLYAIQDPSVDPQLQQHYVPMDDGVQLFVEVWLPAPKDGHVPPSTVPTIVTLTPYGNEGQRDGDNDALVDNVVPRGYAYAQVHVRGTGNSGGCFDFNGAREQEDTEAIIAWLANDDPASPGAPDDDPASPGAPWSDGRLGLYGISYRGGTAAEAITVADKSLTSSVKAAVMAAPTASRYEQGAIDGAPLAYPQSVGIFEIVLTGVAVDAHDVVCSTQYSSWVGQDDGDFFAAMAEREMRRGASTIQVPVLMAHGHADTSVPASIQSGFFDRIPDDVSKAGVFGHFGHEWPDGDGWDELNEGKTSDEQVLSTVPEWTRTDWQDMVTAWFDHFVKEIPSGVELWPVAQVQGNDGLWRAEHEWPFTGGPAGRLALDAGGKLGSLQPSGSTQFIDGSFRNQHVYEAEPSTNGYAPGTSARFDYVAQERLELTGQAEVSLWVSLEGPVNDAHLSAFLQTFDAEGRAIPFGSTVGARSVQHLEPIDDYFKQEKAVPPPDGIFEVRIRLRPTDLVVPAGGRLSLTVAASAPVHPGLGVGDGFEHPTALSGSGSTVTIWHDCGYLSELRFVLPDDHTEWLDVGTIAPETELDRKELPNSFDGGSASDDPCS